MKKVLLYLIMGVLFLAGFLLLLYPVGESAITEYRNKETITHFQKLMVKEIPREDDSSQSSTREEPSDAREGESTAENEKTAGKDLAYEDLLREMREYNQGIYEEEQESLCDAWSYQQNVFDFHSAGLEDDMVGYITIDAMNIEIPLYIGANEENMGKGAVVLSQTSMPIGGDNTNCVIAAHRGWYTSPMFQDIEVLQPGDEVKVTSLWGTLTYEVVKCIVIYPDDIEAVKIQEGQDLLTLVTCHPYTKNYQRYVVYCSRTGGELAGSQESVMKEKTAAGEEGTQVTAEEDTSRKVVIPYEGVAYESSREAIRRERRINRAGSYLAGGAAVILVLVLLIRFIKRKKKNRD